MSSFQDLILSGQFEAAIALVKVPSSIADDLRQRATAYCEAMRDGRLEHEVQVAGIRFRLGISRRNFGHDLFVANGEVLEAREMSLLAGLPIAAKGFILDIGANSGSYTIYLAKLFPNCTIVPIECEPGMCDAIRANVALNRLTNVDLRHLGVAAGAREGTARLSADRTLGAVGTRVHEDSDGPVAQVTVDALGLAPIAFAKIDVEGGEMDVLTGMERTLSQQHFPLLVEVRKDNLLPLLGFLCRWQYRVRAIVRRRPGADYANFLLDRR